MNFRSVYKFAFSVLFCSFYLFGFSQKDSVTGIPLLRQLINDNKTDEAQAELIKQINEFTAVEDFDTLVNYIEFVGSYSLSKNNRDVALEKAVKFSQKLLKLNDTEISIRTLKELAWIYDEAGKPGRSYKTAEEALEYASQLHSKKEETIAEINYNMGYYASETGNYPLAKKHYLKSLQLILQMEKRDYVFAQQAYNSLGGIMWREGKLDSCNYYFSKSLEALKHTEDIPANSFYRPSLVHMNMAVVSNMMGKNNEAIVFSKNAIKGFQSYIDQGLDEQKKNAAKSSQLSAIDNLGVFYNAIGEFHKAEKLITYSFEEKKKMMSADAPRLIISKIILAQAKINTLDFDGAAKLLDESILAIESGITDQLYWYSTALLSRAKIYDQNGEMEKASEYYAKGESVFRKALNGNYNNEFLIELNNMAVFYAKTGNTVKAKRLAKETFNVIQNGDFKNTQQELINLVAIADIYYQIKDYKNAIHFSEDAIDFNINNKLTLQDSVLFGFSKPRAILIHAKSQYHLQTNKTEIFLNKLLVEIEKGLQILEQRKSIINSMDDLNQLLSQNNELIHFAKKIRLELFYLTKNDEFLSDLLKLHESSVYNRIRARFNIKNEINFDGIPESVVRRETFLKEKLAYTLRPENNTDIQSFMQANKELENFIDSLKSDYPKYYKMRYATLEHSLDNLSNEIPKNTTVIRYLFIEEDLYVLIITKTDKKIYKLDFENGQQFINKLTSNRFDINEINLQLQELYKLLWQPFADKVTTDNVIIIPDGTLFNLSFEILTPTRINSFKEFATSSLLAKYNISYNYSLFLLGGHKNIKHFNNNFVAFAPEFTREMKDNYKDAISDSVFFDKAYLRLLTQPFTADLIQEYSRLFNGSFFLKENASKQSFTNKAKEHKIIHIGTHAESNNISPELSRLIFAKNTEDTLLMNDNSLYAYEIYDQNLSSNITILTACETGKPTYQAGEGMISLAHAFNYAGSESILTILWKADEQSSAEITGLFYKYIAEGLAKDKALRLAKLDYISASESRTISPQYWAGLVLIGDTSPIEITRSNMWIIWLGLGLFSILLVLYFYRKKEIQILFKFR